MTNADIINDEPRQPSRRYITGEFVAEYDANSSDHLEGFVERLTEQGQAHGREIAPAHAHVVANAIGPDFQVTMICGELNGQRDIVKGMTTTTVADFAEGRFLYLEDIVVTPDARRQGYAKQLIYSNLIDAWNTGYTGYAWETGRKNESGRMLYSRIDPAFNTGNLHDVWRLSARQSAAIQNIPGARGHLAVPDDLNNIATTLVNQPDKDLGHLSRILAQQEHNGINADSFIVASDNGSFAIVSKGYSTFEGSKRSDVRLYLTDKPSQDDVASVIKAVSFEITKRKWRGSQHIEFSNNVIGVDKRTLCHEKDKVALAAGVLKDRFGAEPLAHDNDNMVAYSLTGKRYVAAVIEAVRRNRGEELTPDSRRRLEQAAKHYGLAFGQAA